MNNDIESYTYYRGKSFDELLEMHRCILVKSFESYLISFQKKCEENYILFFDIFAENSYNIDINSLFDMMDDKQRKIIMMINDELRGKIDNRGRNEYLNCYLCNRLMHTFCKVCGKPICPGHGSHLDDGIYSFTMGTFKGDFGIVKCVCINCDKRIIEK